MQEIVLWSKAQRIIKPTECRMTAAGLREKILAVEIKAYPKGSHERCSELYAFKSEILCQSYTDFMDEYRDHFQAPLIWSSTREGSLPYLIGSGYWNIGFRPKELSFVHFPLLLLLLVLMLIENRMKSMQLPLLARRPQDLRQSRAKPPPLSQVHDRPQKPRNRSQMARKKAERARLRFNPRVRCR